MAKSRNGMLGVGGQRRNLSRKALRGGSEGGRPSGDAAAAKKELLRKMRERNAQRDSEA
ncbi:DUF6243 family protein [Actinomadura sp. 21ATH]|uniref:DUF6243 family protein n=1 Tax=Actinomadura sp. 21ATH TaxID=1735444 RepID=UPI0035BEFFFE